MEKELTHKDCGGDIKISLEDDNACGDPECCGTPQYEILIKCERCGKKETIYD